MKLLIGKKETYSYLKKIRSNDFYKIKSSGNGYFSKEYTLDTYVKKVNEMTNKEGDDFLVNLSSKIDGKAFGKIEVPKTEINNSLSKITKKEKNAIQSTIDRVKVFQEKTLNKSWFDESKGYGEYIKPVESIGCYIPSGSAPEVLDWFKDICAELGIDWKLS